MPAHKLILNPFGTSDDKNSSSLPTNLPAFELQWYDDPQKSTQSEMFLNDKNFSLETSRDPGCSAGVSGISVPHKEPSMASSSAQADVLSCESLSSGEVDRALGSYPLDSEPEKKKRLKLHLVGILLHSAYSSVIIGVCN
ncbi:uncharacterized protein LOC129976297 isoform X2 [Argiope bruennichi]|uniref:uncharacterized protein LOC129976297 isoform X2 n=1 Tax=Argiope bruennichi TaxID=94029 RepID=UPI0024945455|nr:uncharacterized protein LOC129976297 isoform X2 [Argiope bruennichi]